MSILTLEIPYPPSTNHYWKIAKVPRRGGRGFHHCLVVNKKGLMFRRLVNLAVKYQARDHKTFIGRLDVTISVRPPDKRKRDLDNVLKATLDALAHAGVYADDWQIDDLQVHRDEKIDGGSLLVSIIESNAEAAAAAILANTNRSAL